MQVALAAAARSSKGVSQLLLLARLLACFVPALLRTPTTPAQPRAQGTTTVLSLTLLV
jgi:hypothetical protein